MRKAALSAIQEEDGILVFCVVRSWIPAAILYPNCYELVWGAWMFRNLGNMLAGTTLMVAFVAPLGLTQAFPKAPVKTAATTAKEVDLNKSTTAVRPGDWPMYSRDLTS